MKYNASSNKDFSITIITNIKKITSIEKQLDRNKVNKYTYSIYDFYFCLNLTASYQQ